MDSLARFVMRGRAQAVLATAGLGWLSLFLLLALPLGVASLLLVPFPLILASSAVGLVTLRQGARDGLLTGIGATLLTGLLALLMAGNLTPVIGISLLNWLPLWGLGASLRVTRSLSLSLQAGLLFGLLYVAALYLLFSDPVGQWSAILAQVGSELDKAGAVDMPQWQQLTQAAVPWITGVMAVGYYLLLVVALLLARSWQARLYNPGGFRQEFLALRVARPLVLLALALTVLGLLSDGGSLGTVLRDLGPLVGALFALQGLAVAHAVVAAAGMSTGWLVALYLLLFFVTLHAGTLLALIGLTDSFADYRARFASRGKTGG